MILGVRILKKVSIGGLSIPVSTSFQLVIEVLVIVFGLALVNVGFCICALASKWKRISCVAVSWFYLSYWGKVRIGWVLCIRGIGTCML